MSVLREPHLDSNETVFFTRQLEAVKARTYDVKYSELKAMRLLPVNSSINPGADTITWRSYDRVGQARVIADYAKDFPRVDVYGVEKTQAVRDIGASFGYSLKEIRRAQFAGVPLEQRRANAARKSIETLINHIAWFGDEEYQLNGMINYPGISEFSTTAWAGKTADEVLKDITDAMTAVADFTNGIEVPDTLLLPLAQYNYLQNTPYGDNKDKTLLTYIRNNLTQLRTIEWVAEMKGGSAGADCGLLFKRDEEHITLEIPLAFEMHAPQQENLAWSVACDAACGGIINYYPVATVKLTGI
jgi:hypothetical protein